LNLGGLQKRGNVITSYTPAQKGPVERLFRSLKEECVWLHDFGSFTEARTTITKWIEWYYAELRHQSLAYRNRVSCVRNHPNRGLNSGVALHFAVVSGERMPALGVDQFGPRLPAAAASCGSLSSGGTGQTALIEFIQA